MPDKGKILLIATLLSQSRHRERILKTLTAVVVAQSNTLSYASKTPKHDRVFFRSATSAAQITTLWNGAVRLDRKRRFQSEIFIRSRQSRVLVHVEDPSVALERENRKILHRFCCGVHQRAHSSRDMRNWCGMRLLEAPAAQRNAAAGSEGEI